MSEKTFDPYEKERRLRKDSDRWITGNAVDAQDGDIPILDLSEYLISGSESCLNSLASELRYACEKVGFFSIVGHQLPTELVDQTFEMVRRFHSLPLHEKRSLLMDRPDWPVGGVGYLPLKNKKLPARNTGNLNEAFLIKCDHKISLDQNLWPDEGQLPSFRSVITRYAAELEQLSKRMLPIFSTALEMPEDFFNDAFEAPMYRLRMTHYPPAQKQENDNAYGIAPHVDTTFFTLLAQDQPGLTIYSEQKQQWLNAPLIEGAFIVNSGELLRQWSNDRFLSTKHFANNNRSGQSRYSIPFFLNANTDYVMSCIPSCCGPENPAKYPPISYSQSQAVAQGE